MKTLKQKLNKINLIITAWESLAPTATFFGMTLAQFKAAMKPMLDLNEQMGLLTAEIGDVRRRLCDGSGDSHDLALAVVASVKGDPNYGENSTLYAAMGYIRKSERKSGLTHKIVPLVTPTPAAE